MKVAQLLLMVGLAVLATAQMAGAVYVTAYSEDFSSDPGYDSQDPTNVYWDGGQGNYYAKVFDVSSGYGYYMAYSPEFPLVDIARDFKVQFDFMVITPDWGSYPGITFQNTLIPDWNPLMPDGNTFSFRTEHHWDSYDRGFYLRSETVGLYTADQPSAEQWYTFFIQYHANAQTVDWVVKDESGLVWYEGLGLACPIDAGFNRLYIGEISYPPRYGDWSDIRVDNIVVSALVSPYIVDCTGAGDFLTIQEAIDVASEGDTVLIAPCVYTGEGNRDLDFAGTNIVVRSIEGPDNTIIDCQGAGRGFLFHNGENSTSVIEGLTIKNGIPADGMHGGGIGMYGLPSVSPTITRCKFIDNGPNSYGTALYIDGGGAGPTYAEPHISECYFEGNSNWCVYNTWYGRPTFTDCVFTGNPDRALYCWSSQPILENCTFYGNGTALRTAGTAPNPILSNCIIAFNTNSVIGVATLTCSDIYGNSNGDWVGPIAPQYGVTGNISADPLFCDAENGVFTLSTDSPCARWENPDCGQIGALGVGCEAEVPVVTNATDVGNDQGRQARLRWLRSMYDASGQPVAITGYGIYRRQDEYKSLADDDVQASDAWAVDLRGGRLDGWDYLFTVPARGDSAYQCVAPTLCDSTESDGACWSVFMVSAMTPSPPVYFDSRADSGYSIDNLAPEAPGNLATQYVVGSHVNLTWDKNEEEDLDFYAVYGSASESGTPALLGYAVDEYFEHVPPSADYWYWVTAWDLNENEGEPSTPAAVALGTGVDDTPLTLSLSPAVPNPFGAVTSIAYELPQASVVTLDVYDVSGRNVKTLLRDVQEPAGRHVVQWNGCDDAGKQVATGVYFYRVEVGEERLTEKVMLVR